MEPKLNKKELWLNIKNYHFQALVPAHLWDHVVQVFGGYNASTKAFAHKIAGKHYWNTDFAMQAIAEYKKFVYLGVISDFSVSPPKVIDKVWHEHILFSKAYRQFCDEVICYPFDHSPELIALPKQTAIYNAQYQNTLALYRVEFGEEPPRHIWGTTKFEVKTLKSQNYQPRKKNPTADSDVYDYGDTPLIVYFGSDGDTHGSAGFGGFEGGHFGGGGSGDSWDSGDGGGHDGGDSGTGDSGGDSGGGDGGGSGCSSGCGSSCGGCGGG